MRRFSAEGALVVAAFLFGVTFPLVHDALNDVTPFAYLVLRFSIAVLVLAPFALAIARRQGDDRRLLIRVGIIAGVLLFGGYATQTVGLQYTSPSTSAFITGLYVMFTPLIEAVVQRAWPPRRVLASTVIATFGLYLLTGADLGLGRGELLTLVCAFLFAVWIVYQGGYAARLHPIPFTTMQMVTLVVVGLPAMARQGVGHLSGQAVVCHRVHWNRVLGGRALAPALGAAPHPADASRIDLADGAGVRRPGRIHRRRATRGGGAHRRRGDPGGDPGGRAGTSRARSTFDPAHEPWPHCTREFRNP